MIYHLLKNWLTFFMTKSVLFLFLEISFLRKISHIIQTPEIKQYYIEIYHLLFIDKELNSDFLQNHKIKLYQILNIIYNTKVSDIFYLFGKLYYDGKIAQQDFIVSIEYFDISADFGNADAIFHIRKIYYNGQGVTRDYKKAIE